jgi:hypothetical protein
MAMANRAGISRISKTTNAFYLVKHQTLKNGLQNRLAIVFLFSKTPNFKKWLAQSFSHSFLSIKTPNFIKNDLLYRLAIVVVGKQTVID